MKSTEKKKKMSKRIFLRERVIVLLVISFFLVSCGGSGPSGPTAASYNFKQGTITPQLKLLENNPPKQIYPNSNFNIVVGVENVQAYDIENVILRLVGIDDMFFQFYNLEGRISLLEGKSLLNPPGGKHFFEFNGQSKELFQNAKTNKNNYFVKLSYDSTLDFSDTLCINSNLYDTYDSGCKVDPKKSYSGQGAPITVTQVEEIISPFGGGGGNVEFRVRVSNKGGGKSDKVELTSAKLGNEEILCEFQGAPLDKKIGYFKDNKKDLMLICKDTLSNQYSYTTTLLLSFAYDYTIKKQETLNLIK
tara:strand:+ start:233 stop:1147 length:915 start_codon:yes stop_codon:yes gene_type:complete